MPPDNYEQLTNEQLDKLMDDRGLMVVTRRHFSLSREDMLAALRIIDGILADRALTPREYTTRTGC